MTTPPAPPEPQPAGDATQATPPSTPAGPASDTPSQDAPAQAQAQPAQPITEQQQAHATGIGSGASGIGKCPNCGSSDVALDIPSGELRCNYCRGRFSAPIYQDRDIHELRGLEVGSAAGDIIPSADVLVTFKCPACGAEVVVDTAHALQARCHWCRNTLSVNEQIPNGAVPDAILPFRLTKEQAQAKIQEYVDKRKFFANRRFLQEFTADNVIGVYLPYMVVDSFCHAAFQGEGEHETRRYYVTVGSGNSQHEEARYDADVYAVAREFDLLVDDLTVEAKAEYLDQDMSRNTNNIINAIMPFPTEQAVHFDANYLRGFNCEKRDANIEELRPLVETQTRDIARYRATGLIDFYDRGVRWEQTTVQPYGEKWKTAYLPVWLYSYLETKKDGQKLLHYVACNGATGETVGSVPLHMSKLLGIAVLPVILGLACMVASIFI